MVSGEARWEKGGATVTEKFASTLDGWDRFSRVVGQYWDARKTGTRVSKLVETILIESV